MSAIGLHRVSNFLAKSLGKAGRFSMLAALAASIAWVDYAAMAAESDQELPRIAAAPKYSEEEVLEAVSKRIEQQREEGLRKNKIIN